MQFTNIHVCIYNKCFILIRIGFANLDLIVWIVAAALTNTDLLSIGTIYLSSPISHRSQIKIKNYYLKLNKNT